MVEKECAETLEIIKDSDMLEVASFDIRVDILVAVIAAFVHAVVG